MLGMSLGFGLLLYVMCLLMFLVAPSRGDPGPARKAPTAGALPRRAAHSFQARRRKSSQYQGATGLRLVHYLAVGVNQLHVSVARDNLEFAFGVTRPAKPLVCAITCVSPPRWLRQESFGDHCSRTAGSARRITCDRHITNVFVQLPRSLFHLPDMPGTSERPAYSSAPSPFHAIRAGRLSAVKALRDT
jgi:hypothetical protein